MRHAGVGDELHDGGGLIGFVVDRGVRWLYRYTSPVSGRRREQGLGFKSLADARKERDRSRDLVKSGVDPLFAREREAAAQRAALDANNRDAQRQQATLVSVARTYHSTIMGDFRNRKHRAQWLASIEGSLPRALLDKPVSEITPADLLDVLIPLRERVPETARRVRQRLDAVFADAALRGLCAGNPAALIVRRMRTTRRQGDAAHLRSLHYRDVPAFVAALRDSTRIGLLVKLAIEFGILATARSGEVRGARWSEIDMTAKLWTIPAARMKGRETHRVHLSPRALAILEEAKALRLNPRIGALVFPPPRDGSRPLSDMTLTQALRRLPTGRTRDDGKPETYADLTTMHGLARATFSTWTNSERIASSDVIEAALAHRETDRVKAAYDRSAKEGERFERDLRALRLAWSDYACGAKRGKVVSIRAAQHVR
jgi:integrase